MTRKVRTIIRLLETNRTQAFLGKCRESGKGDRMKRQCTVCFFLLICGALFLLAGCAATGPVGKWQVDRSVKHSFEAGTVLPDHTYYYLGSFAVPDSVIAIDNRFVLRTRVWAQVDISQKMLNGWLSWINTRNFGSCEYYGGVILTPEGEYAGIWYSQNIINTIRMPEPGVLVVFQPISTSGRTCGDSEEGRASGIGLRMRR